MNAFTKMCQKLSTANALKVSGRGEEILKGWEKNLIQKGSRFYPNTERMSQVCCFSWKSGNKIQQKILLFLKNERTCHGTKMWIIENQKALSCTSLWKQVSQGGDDVERIKQN